jgi:hypothetical protein
MLDPKPSTRNQARLAARGESKGQKRREGGLVDEGQKRREGGLVDDQERWATDVGGREHAQQGGWQRDGGDAVGDGGQDVVLGDVGDELGIVISVERRRELREREAETRRARASDRTAWRSGKRREIASALHEALLATEDRRDAEEDEVNNAPQTLNPKP